MDKTADARHLPPIVNIEDIRELTDGPMLLHFTPEQWRSAMREVVEDDEVDEIPEAVTATELGAVISGRLPGDELGQVVTITRCPPGCDPMIVIRYQAQLDPNKDRFAFTPYPDAVIIPNCNCPIVEPDPEPRLRECRVVFRLPTAALSAPRMACVDTRGRDCQGCILRSRRLPDGRRLIYCACL